MNTGKCIRLGRIINRQSKKTVMVPVDHGVTLGPVTGLSDIRQSMIAAGEGGANAMIMHKGIAKECYAGHQKNTGLIIHLSASTTLSTDPDYKILVASPLEALKLGADAVSIHVNVGSDKEFAMLDDLGRISRESEELGLPLLAMMYARGKNIHNQYDADLIAHACRVGAELGADLIKTNYSGDPDSFKKVVKGCPVPVLVAGGLRTGSDLELLEKIRGAMEAGAGGVAIGRNVFMHENPVLMVRRISAVVHNGLSPAEAMKL
ncbi:2-amino-3,7-dideoxy-D-threo-hept-6-ulosonate synthase [Methanocella arvoryzae]|uniref:2-amino-3,7-dideoxy-D-threo-hept-6-ulosonate synthase n=1 Tax=Methanocella arvoryzae (strain DSM 22066 / NBRC 105507 / MRE50) TaxID=351160 RepID=Q0W189_METAR|nr:2-amino-3,7-dideoxy-D-threo-hept-6-ulosonate synthase [Methanocella arvoryzae]CAJ37854.1 putative fructose-bisphosphate aldolase (class I) [Methanocella arvoryzae MRE50]